MNKKLLGVGALALAVALTSASVSGTYAKYTSDIDGGTDSARVAIWNFNGALKAGNDNIFSETYKAEDSTSANAVVGGADVVAPGTFGKYTFAFDKENMETETNYTIIPSVTFKTEYNDKGANMPFKFYVVTGAWGDSWEQSWNEMKESLTPVTISESATDDNIQTAISNALKKEMENWIFSPTADPSTKVVSIIWEWPFTSTDNDVNDNKLNTTELLKESATKFTIGIKANIEQSNKAATVTD